MGLDALPILANSEDIKRRQANYPKEYWDPETNTCDYPELEDPYANVNCSA